MSSIKDKPLKKIVCDKRITIDAIHNNKINKIKENLNIKSELESKISDLQNKINNESDIHVKINLENELLSLKNESKKFNSDEQIDYYLNNGLLLSDYYEKDSKFFFEEKPDNKKKKTTILDYMDDNNGDNNNNNNNNNNAQDNNYDQIISNYLINTNDEFINDFDIIDINLCKNCSKKLTIKYINSEIVCETCGYTEKIMITLDGNSYKDPIRESTYFAYKRINHFNEWLAQFQAKETTDISQEVYNNILKELKKDKSFNINNNLSYKIVRDCLKKLKYNKFYEHIPHIINIISGEKSPILTRSNEEQLRIMFKEIQTPFMNNCPDDRKNFLSYSYVLHKFCELLELDHLLVYFPLLKSREKLQQQDAIWKKICKDLKWQYIPSV
uniref:Viral late gene transcription factor 3 zinc ribbon domain-containing protein n=1 Tax=viral metagenome TaxID=1070528 RepID=A0A6C0C6A4_9ZZZZ